MLVSLLSGLISAFSLPTSFVGLLPNFSAVIWFSLIPLYLSIRKKRASGSFSKGFLFGLAYYGLSLYWIIISLYHYGEVPLYGAIGALIALVIILSIFTGLITYVSVWIHRQGGPIFWAFPLSWTAAEFIRNYFPFNGFPWGNIAYSQHSFLTLLQSLDIFGVYGITFLIVLINAALGEVIYYFIREAIDDEEVVGHKRWGSPWVAVGLSILFFSGACIYGTWRIKDVRQTTESFEHLNIGLIQGNVLQNEKWLEDHVEEIIQRHVTVSEELQKEKPDLIIWPESSFPAILPPHTDDIESLRSIEVPLLMGMLTYEGIMPLDDTWPPPAPQAYEGEPFTMYNGAALIGAKGQIKSWHFKSHLVPMGEYVPLKKYFFFLEKIVPGVSDFSPGKTLDLMSLNIREGTPEVATYAFGTTICYEDLFPEISRAFVNKGADFLVNVTNDAWYDQSSAIFQHFDFSRFRAIENRRSMVRVTNTGLTGVFDPTGNIIHSFPPFVEAKGIVSVPVGKMESYYARRGDIFAWACVVLVSLLLIMSFVNAMSVNRGESRHVE